MPSPDAATAEQAALMAVTLALGGYDGRSLPADATDLMTALGGQPPDWPEVAGRLAGICAGLVIGMAAQRDEDPAELWQRMATEMPRKRG